MYVFLGRSNRPRVVHHSKEVKQPTTVSTSIAK